MKKLGGQRSGCTIIKLLPIERGCREEVEMKLKVGHWSVERKCQRGVVIQDRWVAF